MEKLSPEHIENILALTPMQEGMLFHYLQDPQSRVYFEQLSLNISGEIDIELFKKAWDIVIKTNETLRTVFRWEKLEKPSQIILKQHPCEIRSHDLSGVDNLEEIKTKDRDEGFDLTRVPFRIILCKLAEAQYEMVISNHHILYDGWSNGIILKEFFNTYHALSKGEQAPPLPTKPSFKEYIKWLQNRDKKKQERYWQEYLAGFETSTELPIKRRVESDTTPGDYSIILEEDIKGKLDVFVKTNRVTLASVFYTAWGILLQKYCNSEDVIFGTPVSGRAAAIKGIKDMVGLFINTVPLRIQSASNVKLIDIISDIENVLRMRAEFESTPLPDIRGYSTVDGSGSLFDTLVVIENYPLDNRLLPENSLLSINSYSMVEVTHYDLSVGIMPFNKIEIKFSFKQDLLEKDYLENLAGHFKSIIRNIIENPGTGLSQLEIISIEEKNRILHEFNNTATEYPRDKTIHQLFEEQVSKTPDHIAVVGNADVEVKNVGAGLRVCPVNLTYRQLNEQSNQLAGVLIDKGVQTDAIVGIMVERSVEMVVGIIGILKSGGAYLPIDPEYPQERIEYMLKDSGSQLLVTTYNKEGEKVRKWEREKVILESIIYDSNHLSLHHSSFNVHRSNLAYIIYTSGSTGRPKGVMINHGSAVNLLFAMQDQYPFTPANTYLLKTSYTFDVSVTELCGWYMGGGRLAILETNSEKDPFVILNCIHRHRVTHINFVPSMFNVFLDFVTEKNKGWLRSLKYIFLAGEALLPLQVKNFLDLKTAVELKNIYGPTEGTVYSSQYPLFDCTKMSNIPIGKPLPNIELYILNKYNHLQPLGVAGELCITGVGLSRGYLNRVELTHEKFKIINYKLKIKNGSGALRTNFSPSSFILHYSKLYRTGDLARWLSDGNIEFLGRIDYQIKIRGFRIELGEIENRLLKHPEIKEAFVLSRDEDNGGKYLCAYIVAARALEKLELREYLSKELPTYMIPSYFIQLDHLLLNRNGKVDRASLPEPRKDRSLSEKTYAAPQSDVEKIVADIWKQVLKIDTVGIHDNFFDIGGNSFYIIRLSSKLKDAFKKEISVTTLFNYPTISAQAKFLSEQDSESSGSPIYA
ncbi:MAG TPA: amino acid adenylation domain-containing protein, partial [Candidatus Deferrimicrobium sp.]|nr:amino acid adenylation domain-containing protein [Candidatus Deferrimicrobium sp.]